MTSLTGEELGHGVYASPGAGGELTVTSPRLDLPWRAAEGQVPGTAVLWGGHSYEVVGRTEAGSGARWTLRRWDQPTAMRNVFRLDRESVHHVSERAETELRNRRARVGTLFLLPILGFAPAAIQKKWANEWGFAADRATTISAILEILAGGAGTIQLAATAFGADFFIPPLLAVPGPLLFVFGAARLAMVFGDGEPVGSPLGTPFLLLAPKTEAEPERTTPTVRLFEEDEGTLVLASPILRKDWDRDGLLRYRDGLFRLDRTEQEGRFWVYHFERGADGGGGERALQLRPPAAVALPSKVVESAPPSFVRTMLMTAAMTLAPAADQKRWAAEQGINAIWLTALGAVAELIGGVANLNKDLGNSHPLLIVFDFYLVGEGLVRLGSSLAGRPMGSVFGWILRPLYGRYLPPDTSSQ
jgi:hypothetical protein